MHQKTKSVKRPNRFVVFDLDLFQSCGLRETLLMGYLMHAITWTQKKGQWFYLSREKILDDMNGVFKNALSLRRAFLALKKAGLIFTCSFEHKDWFTLSESGQQWLRKKPTALASVSSTTPIENPAFASVSDATPIKNSAHKVTSSPEALPAAAETASDFVRQPLKNTMEKPLIDLENQSTPSEELDDTAPQNVLFEASERTKKVHADGQKKSKREDDTYIYNKNKNNHTHLTVSNAREATRPAVKASAKRFSAREALKAAGVDEQHATAWLAYRKEKRKPLTASAWARIQKAVEAVQSQGGRLDLNEAVALMASRGWLSICADWESVQWEAGLKGKSKRRAYNEAQTIQAPDEEEFTLNISLDEYLSNYAEGV